MRVIGRLTEFQCKYQVRSTCPCSNHDCGPLWAIQIPYYSTVLCVFMWFWYFRRFHIFFQSCIKIHATKKRTKQCSNYSTCCKTTEVNNIFKSWQCKFFIALTCVTCKVNRSFSSWTLWARNWLLRLWTWPQIIIFVRSYDLARILHVTMLTVI
jgi:hypothetical protein